MNITQSGTAPARQAALAAHALGSEDQAWLMEALAPAHRAMLQPLLDDLKAVGIPREAPQLPDAAGVRRLVTRLAPGASRSAQTQAWPSPDAVADWLSREPADLVLRILDLQDWPWQAEVRRRLGLEGSGPVPAAPALDAWLRTEVQAALQALPPSAPESLLARWLRRMRERGHA